MSEKTELNKLYFYLLLFNAEFPKSGVVLVERFIFGEYYWDLHLFPRSTLFEQIQQHLIRLQERTMKN